MALDELGRQALKFRCTGCGTCCRETVVLITDADVRRMVAGLDARGPELVRFFRPDELEMEKRHPFWIRFDSGPAVMGLRWKNGHCRFLGKDDLCTIYEHRPVTCRDFPFSVTFDARRRVQELRLATNVCECPHEWDGEHRLGDVKRVAALNEDQSEEYGALVKKWNRSRRGPKTRPAFLRFLGLPEAAATGSAA